MQELLSLACAGLAGAGLLQSGAGYLALCRSQGRRLVSSHALPPVTVLKPLHGDEPLLEAALASFCAQDYPDFQIVFGVQDGSDPALAIVRNLRRRFPAVAIDVVIDPRRHGSNGKVSNLINMLEMARNEVLLISDSDMHAPPGYLRRVVQTLGQPGVGLVTTLWAGHCASDTAAGRLGAAYINRDFLPSVALSRVVGRQDCLGATMALTRATLQRIGGFEALANHVADDALLGKLVRAEGLNVALAPTIPATTVPETTLPDLFAHELRWARTTKAVEPAGYAVTMLQYPMFWAAVAVALADGAPWALLLFAAAWYLRGLLAHGFDRALSVASPLTIWCLPLRDLLSMAVFLASYASNRVAWRGSEHRVTRLEPGKG